MLLDIVGSVVTSVLHYFRIGVRSQRNFKKRPFVYTGQAVVPAVETSPGVAQAQPRLKVHEAHVEVHALAHQGAALLCEEEEFGSAPDASSSVEDDDE